MCVLVGSSCAEADVDSVLGSGGDVVWGFDISAGLSVVQMR